MASWTGTRWFEPSSPHLFLFIYTDGGADHILTYLPVKLSLISIFLKLDLDFLCVARTAPHHSWRNPAKSHSVLKESNAPPIKKLIFQVETAWRNV